MRVTEKCTNARYKKVLFLREDRDAEKEEGVGGRGKEKGKAGKRAKYV